MTPTGTNLLGLVKHLAYVEAGYFGDTFGRPDRGASPRGARTRTTSRTGTCGRRPRSPATRSLGLYRRAWALADATIAALPLDAPGTGPVVGRASARR